jgi:hypothetical protein
MKVLVITAPGLRPDYLGCYGSDWVDTPNIDQLAAAGIVFDNYHAVQPDGDGACRAWRTGTYRFPAMFSSGGAREFTEQPDLLSLLNANTVATYLIADSGRPPSKDFSQGWKTFRPSESMDSHLKAIHKAIDRQANKENTLLWIDLPVLLPPWQIPSDFIAAYFQRLAEEDADESSQAEEDKGLVPLIDPQPGVFASLDDGFLLQLQRGNLFGRDSRPSPGMAG